jgi:poly(3-hydroxybutyrate) depolymerase
MNCVKGLDIFESNPFLRYYQFMQELSRPIPEPRWYSPNRIVFDLPRVSLRDFSVGDDDVTILILPPTAGHATTIVDFAAGKSMVEATIKAGFKQVFVADFKEATEETKSSTLDDRIMDTHRLVQFIGRPVIIIGTCQGGTQAAIYTARFPWCVEKLVVVAASIDCHAGFSKIGAYANFFPMSFFDGLVAVGNGKLDGRFQILGFKMLNPAARFFWDFVDLYANIHDQSYLDRYHQFRDWYECPQALPGPMYRRLVEDLFRENLFVRGELEILGKKVNLRDVTQPLFLIAGEDDDISPHEQVYGMVRYVGSSEVYKFLFQGGHLGVFIGGESVQKEWPKVFEKLRG